MLRIVLTGDTLSLEGMLGREEAGREEEDQEEDQEEVGPGEICLPETFPEQVGRVHFRAARELRHQ